MSNYDVIIVGSGTVGSLAALALAKDASLTIGILDSQSPSQSYSTKFDHRVSAISLYSERTFKKLKVWNKITQKRVTPYTHMHVWEELGKSKIDFDCRDINEHSLGYIIEDSVIRTSLHETFTEYPNIQFLHPIKLIGLQEKSDCIELLADDNRIFSAKLLIGADGANSWVRSAAQIELTTLDYHHTALVTTVKTSLPHQSTAWQRFLRDGPLAFLPLIDAHMSSIVWSTIPSHAEELLAMDSSTFCAALSDAFEKKLGCVLEADKRYHFPLHMRHVKNYVKDKIALIGDAAHTIHPLAGQGVNLGILDAIFLANTIQNALKKERQFYSLATLRIYERARKFDNLTMLKMVEFLKFLFTNDKTLFQSIRSLGLNFTDRTSFIKNFFVNYAVGNREDLQVLE